MRGFSLIETLVYIAVLSLVSTLFVNTLLAMNRSYAVLETVMMLDRAATAGMERMTREIRAATDVDTLQSTLGVSPGVLTVNQIDETGAVSRAAFSILNEVLHISRDGVDQGSLLPPRIAAESLIFRLIDSGKSKAVKIEMRLLSVAGRTRSESYYTTVILRGSYR